MIWLIIIVLLVGLMLSSRLDRIAEQKKISSCPTCFGKGCGACEGTGKIEA